MYASKCNSLFLTSCYAELSINFEYASAIWQSTSKWSVNFEAIKQVHLAHQFQRHEFANKILEQLQNLDSLTLDLRDECLELQPLCQKLRKCQCKEIVFITSATLMLERYIWFLEALSRHLEAKTVTFRHIGGEWNWKWVPNATLWFNLQSQSHCKAASQTCITFVVCPARLLSRLESRLSHRLPNALILAIFDWLCLTASRKRARVE